MSVAKREIKRITTHVLQAMKDQGEKISMLTAYDFSMAKILDDSKRVVRDDSQHRRSAGQRRTFTTLVTLFR